MEAKYILSLSESGSEEVLEELLSYVEDSETKLTSQALPLLSEQCVEYLKRSIKYNQLATLQYIEHFKRREIYTSSKHVAITIGNIILDEIESLLEIILDCTNNNKKHNTGCLLSIIPHLEVHPGNKDRIFNSVFPKLHKLILAGYSKETYLSLIAQKDQSVIKSFTEYEMKYPVQFFWNLDPNKMIDLCFGLKKHWLLEILFNSQKVLTDEGGTLIHSTPFIKKIWQLVLINMINDCTENWDISSNLRTLENLFSLLEYQNCEQSLLLYINEIYRQLNLIKFCLNNSRRKIFFGWCEKLQNHSALSVISQNCDLSHLDWFKVKQALTLNNDMLLKLQNQHPSSREHTQWDIMTYNAYCIMTSIIDIILLETDGSNDNETMASKIEEVKVMISNLHPISYRLEILQNIFSSLFLRYEYFSNEENMAGQHIASHSDSSYFIMKNSLSKQFTESRGFVCKPTMVKELLTLVKHSLTEIQNQKVTKKAEAGHERIMKTFTKNVSNAMYRWQLITSLKVETPPKPTSISSLYNLAELSSDEDESRKTAPALKKKLKLRKRRCKSVNEEFLKSSKLAESGVVKVYDSNSVDKPDFISLMLSSPSSLLALCLEAGEFSKANTILEIYDMGDTEGSIEVSYTERFLATAAQVRNSVMFSDGSPTGNIQQIGQIEILTGMSVVSAAVVSLVESFLSTNRAPYNYQISELVHTYPQLQLYDHKNSTLISIIDLLLSTGIDRNITYGVINVVEKKCQDLNVSTDLDSKQYDFLVFIKNMINIVYDAYQDTSSYARNLGICDILRSDKIPLNFKECTMQKDFLNQVYNFCSELKINIADQPVDQYSLSEETLLNNYKFLLHFVPFSGKDTFDIYSSDKNSGTKISDCAYLKSFHTYLKSISQLLNINTQTEDSTKSEINLNVLNLHLHKIIGDLIFEKKVPIDSIELICKSLGINLIHKIVLNCCPAVKCDMAPSCAYDENFTQLIELVVNSDPKAVEMDSNFETLEISSVCRKPNKAVITHILIHNWVIANLVKKIHSDCSEHILQQSLDARTRFLDFYLQEEKFDVLKNIYFKNKPLAALQTSHDLDLVFNYLQSLVANGRLKDSLEFIDALSEHQVSSNALFSALRDQILLKLSVRDDDEHNWRYFLYISDLKLQIDNVLQILVNWPYEGATKILEYVCYNKHSVDETVKEQCQRWLSNLPVYEKISQYSSESTWATIYSLSMEDPENVLQILMDSQQFNLCLAWTDLHQVSTNIENLVTHSLVKQWLESPHDRPVEELTALLSEIPTQQAVSLCNDMMFKIRDLPVLKTVVDFLVHNTYDGVLYDNINTGIALLSQMKTSEKIYFWDIINKPLLIIEQYLMNAKLEKLAKLLDTIKPILKTDQVGENLYYNISLINSMNISVNAVDALLRIYASKALDLKSTKSLRLSTQLSSKPDEMFLQSIDSINLMGHAGTFVMPEEVPPRDQWVPDNHTDRCMSCETTIFSILIRRHHCRRCGRLVCYSCSRHKMQVNNLYNNIKVRICNDCYAQTNSKSEHSFLPDRSTTQPGSGSTYSDGASMEWCLNADPRHNEEVRKEFVYEFSPNVTLCLTIMKMHTVNFDYPRFLLDRSAELSLIAGSGGGAGGRELLRMRRALLLCCTVLYSRPLPTPFTRALGAPAPPSQSALTLTETALAHTERQLAATDAFVLLVSHGCHDMMPQGDILDTHCVRRLLEAEKWELALEISTKFSMSRLGVLAAWGKACLKAGCFQQAKQKFAICFKSSLSHTTPYIAEDSDRPREPLPNKSVMRLRKFSLNSSTTQLDSPRNRSNPALLEEIISLLENISYPLNSTIVKKAEAITSTFEHFTSIHKPTKKMATTEPALNIMHALASINRIKQGDFSEFTTSSQYLRKTSTSSFLKKQNNTNEKFALKQKLDPFFYSECLYYLTAYGSHGAIIDFYLKYHNMQEALKYCMDHRVEKETFTETIFMMCLKTGKVNELLKSMSEIDSSWDIWTEYLLHVCRVLEHRGQLEALHMVQAGVGDHIRAAMTCAGLYTQPTAAPHAAALLARAHHLAQARGHLQHVPRKISGQDSNKEASSKTLQLKMDGPALDKHINTICRQLEIAKFLYTCETAGRLTKEVVNKVMPAAAEESFENKCFLPTLFDSHTQKMKLAIIIITCSLNIKEGFDIAVRIVQEHLLDASKVYNHAARHLVNSERYEDILLLCDCIKKWSSINSSSICDGVVEVSVAAVVRKCDSKGQLFDELAELLIQKVDDVAIKISCYIECRILKTAYAHAVKSNRLSDLKRIMREAERLGETKVKNACVKRLQAQQNM